MRQGVQKTAFSTVALLFSLSSGWTTKALSDQPERQEDSDLISETIIHRDFRLTIQCAKVLRADEENLVTIIAHNRSDRMIAIQPLSRLHRAPRFELWRYGKLSRSTKLGEQSVVVDSLRDPQPLTIRRSIPPKIKLMPNEELKTTVNLTRYYDTSKPGEYELIVACTLLVQGDWKNRIQLRTAPLKIQIQAESEEVKKEKNK
jgi:hypothetical protein